MLAIWSRLATLVGGVRTYNLQAPNSDRTEKIARRDRSRHDYCQDE